jgi:hypothetical protein
VRMCVLDAYCSEHLKHEPRWAVLNRAAYNRDIAVVRAVR